MFGDYYGGLKPFLSAATLIYLIFAVIITVRAIVNPERHPIEGVGLSSRFYRDGDSLRERFPSARKIRVIGISYLVIWVILIYNISGYLGISLTEVLGE